MIQPRALEVNADDFPPGFKAWAIQGRSGKYLAIADRRFPGRRPVRFFTSQYDASRVLDVIHEVRPELEMHKLVVVQVALHQALRQIIEDPRPPRADSYVVHPPTEVFEIISQLRQNGPS
jgi:hypothetical protein